MSNQSTFVKVMIWFMVFLMSVGFAALIITPFLGGGNPLFGGDAGNQATLELRDEARAKVRKLNCTETDPKPTGAAAAKCQDALLELGAAYATLASTPDEEGNQPKGYKQNVERATQAYRTAHLIDPSNARAAEQYASILRDQGKAKQALPIFMALSKKNPDEEDYLLQVAVAHQSSGDTAKAIETYRLFIKRFSDSGQVSAIRDQIKELEDQSKPGGGASASQAIDIG